jgi:hypothetical protein
MDRKKIIRSVEIAGALASIVGLALSSDFRAFLAAPLTLPRWVAIVAVLALAAYVTGNRRRGRPNVEKAIESTISRQTGSVLIHPSPKLIAPDHSGSPDPMGTTVMRLPRGTFATWVYLDKPNIGIRQLANNRYLLACTTKVDDPYRSVISLCRGPLRENPPRDPAWKVWLANDVGEGKIWKYPDGPEFQPGWHLFTLRWDHGAPRLELLIDERVVIVAAGFERYWPSEYPDRLLIGCWPNNWEGHFANTSFWRTQVVPECVGDAWIRSELSREVPVAVVSV